MAENYKSPHKKAKKKKDEKTYRFEIDLEDALAMMDVASEDKANKNKEEAQSVPEDKYIYNWLDLITEDKKAKVDKARIYLDDDDDEGQLKVRGHVH